jgi:glutaredoxin
MRKIRILTLNYCDACNWLKRELESEGLKFTNIDVEQHDQFASEIEKMFKTEHYPIIFLDGETDVITILSETNLEPSPSLYIFDTIPQAIDLIRKLL